MDLLELCGNSSNQRRIRNDGRTTKSNEVALVCVMPLMIALVGLGACGQSDISIEKSEQLEEQALKSSDKVFNEKPNKKQSTATGAHTLEHLRDLTQFKSGFERKATVHLLLTHKSADELPVLLHQTVEISRSIVREEAQALIVQRMAEFDPVDTLGHVEGLPLKSQARLTELVFQEWSFGDLNGAVAHAKTLSTTQRMAALHGILKSRDDLARDLRDEIASQVGGDQFAVAMLAQSSHDKTIEFPAIAWDTLLNDAQNELSQVGLLIDVANAWVERDGFSALDRIYSSLTDWEVKIPVLSSVLHELTLGDPHATIQYVVNLEGDYRKNALTQVVLQSLATSDPQGALDIINSTEEAVPRSQMQHSILQTWASTDPNDLLDNIQDVPENLHSAAHEYAIIVLARTDAEMAITLLERSSLKDRRVHVASQIVDEWAGQDAESALQWVLSNPELAKYKEELLLPVFNSLALQDPKRAMELALNQATSQDERGMELIVIDYLARKDMPKAVELLSLVREGPTKVSAYSSVGRALIDKKKVTQLLSLAQSLSDEEQDSFWTKTVDHWAFRKPRLLYKSLDELPYDAIKHKAASRLVELNSHRVKVFSADEVDSLNEMILETNGPH